VKSAGVLERGGPKRKKKYNPFLLFHFGRKSKSVEQAKRKKKIRGGVPRKESGGFKYASEKKGGTMKVGTGGKKSASHHPRVLNAHSQTAKEKQGEEQKNKENNLRPTLPQVGGAFKKKKWGPSFPGPGEKKGVTQEKKGNETVI